MTSTADLAALEAKHKKLLLGMRLPDSALRGDAPEALKHLDMAFARQLFGDEPWGREDAFAENEALLRDVVAATPDGRKLHLAAEIDLLEQVQTRGEDLIHKGPHGLLEAVFPVLVRDRVVHLVRSGRYRATAFTDAELRELAFNSDKPLKDVQTAAAGVPVLGRPQADALLAALRRQRDAAQLALKEHLKARSLVGQQLRTERMSALGTLADGMAHHFSNLLSVILGYSSLLVDKSHVDPESADALKKVVEAAQRGRRFTDEVLALTGGQDEDDARCSVHERIEGVLSLLQTRLPPGAKIERDLAAADDTVLAPPGVLHQLVFSMLASTIDSLPRGGKLRVSTAAGIEDRDLGAQPCLRIVVADGDAEASRGRITSGRSALDTMAGEAVGPQLTSLFGQIGRLDGSVSVQSTEDGQATRIEITLPLAGMRSAAPVKQVRRRLAPSNVLVVDDDPNICEMCRRVLGAEGHTVRDLDSGEALVHALQSGREKPDLVIADFNLPDQNGLELVQWLREAGHRTPVIFITALGPDHPQVAKALKARKSFHLRKPFTFRDLADAVTIALGETLIGED